jgi:hypothetical protein
MLENLVLKRLGYSGARKVSSTENRGTNRMPSEERKLCLKLTTSDRSVPALRAQVDVA